MHVVYTIIGLAITGLNTNSLEATNIEFQPFQFQPGIYFEDIGNAVLTNNEFTFILYFNLSSYWSEWAHIENSTQRIQGWCSRNLNEVEEFSHCTEITHNIQFLRDNINERNQLLKTPKRARRAPLDFVGNVLGDVFGVLDQRDAAYYHEQIITLQNENAHSQTLFQKQTQILDVTTNVMKKESERVTRQYETISQQMRNMDIHTKFIDLALQLTLALVIFGKTQEALVDVVADTHHGRLNPSLITPTQLQEELSQLQTKLPHAVRVPPFDGQWAKLYKIITLKGGIENQTAIFELKLPLLSSDEFQIFHAISMPTLHGNKFIYIDPTTPYLLANRQRSWYYPVTQAELVKCQTWDHDLVICKQRQPLHSKLSQTLRCEIDLFEHEERPDEECVIKSEIPTTYIVPLQKSNAWIAVFPEETTFDVMCKDNTQTVTLQGSGTLRIFPDCTIRNKFLLVTSHSTYTNSRNISFIPHFNLTDQIQPGDYPIFPANLDSDFQRLNVAIARIRDDEPWNHMTRHDYHHYGIGIVLWIMVTVVVCLCWRRRIFLRKLFHTPTTPNVSTLQPLASPRAANARRTST